MNLKEIHEHFKIAPLGLKIIIVLYGTFTALDIVYVFEEFSLNRIVALILSFLTTIGFLLRWEAVRLFYRSIIGFFCSYTSDDFRIRKN